VLLIALGATSLALAADNARYGGIVQMGLAGDTPSLDMDQEQTFTVAQPLGLVYNNLIHWESGLLK
jgi:hypothetical protein